MTVPMSERRRSPRHWWSDSAFRLRLAVVYSDWELLELWTVALALLWGGWLLLPVDTFATARAYAGLAWLVHRVLPRVDAEAAWGLLVFGLGCWQLAGFLTNRQRWREGASLALGTFWTFVAICYIAADWRTTATVVTPLYAAASLAVFSRLYQGVHQRRVREARERAAEAALLAAVDAARDAVDATGRP